MNKYKKYAPNVFLMETSEEYKKGDTATIVSKHGKEAEVKIFNLIGKNADKNFYSFMRLDGINSKTIAQKKAEKLENAKDNKLKKSNEWHQKSKEAADFLVLAEPIKIGHHSEKRHRALIERNDKRMRNCINLENEAKNYDSKIDYWNSKAKEINLSMPESLEFYEYKLNEAKTYHKGLKDGSIEKEHSYSVQYANKKVKDLSKSYELAKKLWK